MLIALLVVLPVIVCRNREAIRTGLQKAKSDLCSPPSSSGPADKSLEPTPTGAEHTVVHVATSPLAATDAESQLQVSFREAVKRSGDCEAPVVHGGVQPASTAAPYHERNIERALWAARPPEPVCPLYLSFRLLQGDVWALLAHFQSFQVRPATMV